MRPLIATLVASLALLVFVPTVSVGCNAGEDLGGLSLGTASTDAAVTEPTSSSSSTCVGDAGTPYRKLADPSTLPSCSPACGGAHCVSGDDIPVAAQSQFAACSGGFCIPDALIKTGGAKPPGCASLGGSAGVCLSMCVPLVAANKDALDQATCAADERCAPCTNPQTGKPTGACDIGASPAPVDCSSGPGAATSAAPPDAGDAAPVCPHVGPPVLDPNKFPACGAAGSGAHCLTASLVPPALVSQLSTCATGYCVPDKIIAAAGNYVPPTCASVASAEGRCQSTVLPAVASQANLPQATCESNEKCVPCFNPIDGTDTGACHTSCDPGPSKPATVLADCCNARGKCATTDMVPASEQPYLNSCGSAGTLCVPDENLAATFTPPKCHSKGGIFGIGSYDGVCLSTCLNFGSNAHSLDRANCDGLHTCVPCKDPNNGNPTHAPGCP